MRDAIEPFNIRSTSSSSPTSVHGTKYTSGKPQEISPTSPTLEKSVLLGVLRSRVRGQHLRRSLLSVLGSGRRRQMSEFAATEPRREAAHVVDWVRRGGGHRGQIDPPPGKKPWLPRGTDVRAPAHRRHHIGGIPAAGWSRSRRPRPHRDAS